MTNGGVSVIRTIATVDAGGDVLHELAAAVETRRGGILGCGMEYPGRYSRWQVAYVDPCMEFTSKGRRLTARALNDRGAVLLPAVKIALGAVGELRCADSEVEVHVAPEHRHLPEEERTRRPTVMGAIRAVTALLSGPDHHLGLYGAFGYDLAFQFEPIRLRRDRHCNQRDLVLHLADELVAYDCSRQFSRISYDFVVDGLSTVGRSRRTPYVDAEPLMALPEQPVPGAYADVVRSAKHMFSRGDLFEVVTSHTLYERCPSPRAFFERLREQNPAPYEFFFNLGDGETLVGASPEMFVRVTGNRVETCPISGTIPRGATALEDAANVRKLLNSTKDEAELTMCTDVDRNDKSRICEPGSVRVIGRRQVEMYSRLIHTVDHVEGRLRPTYDGLDAFLTHMWAVTVTGAPKTWAMQFIEDHEDDPRRWYGGAVGFLGCDGSIDTGLTLRTAQISGGVAAIRVGATLLHDSDPAAEERETYLKAQALRDALAERSIRSVSYAPSSRRQGTGMKVLLVDHEDSFVNTLADYFRYAGACVTTLRVGFAYSVLDDIAPDLVVLSPGPGTPRHFDCSGLLDAVYARGLPVFGVCLGLQAMVEHAGGELATLLEPVHGKSSSVTVTGGQLLSGIPDTFSAGRYHSLYASIGEVRGFDVTAVVGDVVMAIEDPGRHRYGVQFHPESVLTADGDVGHRIIGNLLGLCRPRAVTGPITLKGGLGVR